MNGLDVALVALFCVAFLLGLSAGIVRIALGLVSLLAATLAALALVEPAEAALRGWVSSPELRLLLGFVAVFALVLLGFTLLAWLLRRALEKLGLGLLDRAAGALAGGAAVIVSASLCGALLLELRPRSALISGSLFLGGLAPASHAAWRRLPESWRGEARHLLGLAGLRRAATRRPGGAAASATPGAR